MADRETAAGRSPESREKEDEEMEKDDEEEELFEVERVIGKSKIKGKTMYKVRWKGYGPEEDTWEPIDNLESCLDVVEEYNQRQSELARKRAEERRKRKEREQQSEESSEDPDAPYPASFKNSFWKDLEAGRINVFDNDMYSKVKGRAAKPTDLKEPGSSFSSSENEKSAHQKIRHSSDPEKGSAKLSCRKTQRSKSTVKVKDKFSESHGKGTVKASARKIEFKCLVTSESESDSDMIDKRKSYPLSVNVSSEKDKDVENLANQMHQNAVLRTPERSMTIEPQKTDSAKTVNYSLINNYENGTLWEKNNNENDTLWEKNNTENDTLWEKNDNENDTLWEKPLCETPEGRKITVDCLSSSSSRTINYSSLHDSDQEDLMSPVGFEGENSEDPLVSKSSDRTADEIHHKSPSKKKKKKKHSKHKHHKHRKEKAPSGGSRGGSPLFKLENHSTSELKQKERKRKLSQSSEASSVTGDSVKSFKMPRLELEVSETHVTKIKIRNIHSDLKTGSKNCAENNRNSFNVSENLISRSHSFEKLDSIKTPSSPVVSLANQEKSLSGNNKTPQIVNTCKSPSSSLSKASNHNVENKTIKSSSQPNYRESCGKTVVSEPSRVSNSQSYNSAIQRLERANSEVEQADSGIASPASEDGADASRKPFNNPLDDVLRKTELPLFSDREKGSGLGGDQELEIELDDIDWDLFDQEVKLEPITLTNGEFAAAVETGDYELVKRAFKGDGRYDLESPDITGKTLLMKAAEKAYDDIAELLIQNGAELNAQMLNGATPLILACEHAEICTVNLLLEHGAKVNLQTVNGETALMMAAKRGQKQMLWLLLECGANFNTQSKASFTAMDYIRHLHHTDSEGILSSHIDRVMHEFDKQVAITLNNTADIIEPLFPAQLFNICEDEQFEVMFNRVVTEPVAGVGNLLFVGHAVFGNHEVKCRFYGPCAVKSVFLNGQKQSSLTEEANFVLAFGPLVNGRNVLTINTVKAPGVKAKLIVCAYKAQLINS